MHVRILAADDNPADVFLLRQGLNSTKTPFLIEHVTDGEQAIRRLIQPDGQELPDLLVLDLHLPRLSGQQVVEAIRAHNVPTPIIVLTSMPRERDRVALQSIGVQLVLNKPSDLEGYFNLGSEIEKFYAAGREK